MSQYDETYLHAQKNPEAFWAEAAGDIFWHKQWDKVLDDSNPPYYRWFTGGEVNTCYNALDRHVDEHGSGERLALIYESPVTDTSTKYTYRELREQVARFAGGLTNIGIKKGDRVLIYMPMIPETVIAMLACCRIGAVHSVVFGGFAAPELAKRINDAEPVAVIAGSCGIEPGRIVPYKPLLDEAISIADCKPIQCIIFQREQSPAPMVTGRDLDWMDVMSKGYPQECVPLASTDPLYILYTSGTTGIPKGIVRDNAGHMVALKWSMTHTYDTHPGEVYWAASDVGWVVGHSYIVYAPLLQGCTTVIY